MLDATIKLPNLLGLLLDNASGVTGSGQDFSAGNFGYYYEKPRCET